MSDLESDLEEKDPDAPQVPEEVSEEVPEEELSEIQTKIINAFGVYIENNTIFVSTDL